jgi:outer membrane protein W
MIHRHFETNLNIKGGAAMKKLALLVIPILVIFLMSSAAWADAGDRIFRFGLKYVSPTGDLKETETDRERVTIDPNGWLDFTFTGEIEPDSALGFGIGFEYMFTDLIGIDVTLDYSNHDVDTTLGGTVVFTPDDPLLPPETASLVGSQQGEIDLTPLTVGVNFHVFKSDAVDFYLGPFVGYVFYGDFELKGGTASFQIPSLPAFQESFTSGTISIEDDFAFGAVVGADIPFGGQGWMFSGALKYFKTKAEIDEPGAGNAAELDVDPWEIFVGLGYKW